MRRIFIGVLLSLMLCGAAWGAGKTIEGDLTVTGDFTSGSVVSGGPISVDDTTDSTSTTTGSIHTDGGLGVAKKSFFGDDMNLGGNDIVNSNIQPLVNTKMPSQAVELTAAASGSSGITVADDDDIDFGTGDFTLVWRGSLPDWTPGITDYIITKYDASTEYDLFLDTSNKIGVYLKGSGGVIKTFASASANTFVDGTVHEIVASISRETATVDGSLTVYVDGYSYESAVISAGAGGNLNTTGDLNIQGSVGGQRHASRTEAAYTFNRALTAAQVADLYKNGPSFADKWGSQTELLVTNNGFESGTASPPTGWEDDGNHVATAVADGTAPEGSNVMEIVASGAGDTGSNRAYSSVILTQGKRYRISFYAKTISGNATLHFQHTSNTAETVTVTGSWVQYTAEFIVASTNPNRGAYLWLEGAGTVRVDNFILTELGATLALQPENIQTDKWYDSANGLDASYPAAGASLVRPADDVFPSNVSAVTYGSDSSISDAELLTLDDGATTEILVGGGAGSAPVWTTATGTGAPVRADSPVLSTQYTMAALIVKQAAQTVADEAEITLATGVSGWGFAQAGDNEQWIQFTFTAAGVVTVIANSALAVNTDTDGNLCVYDAGSGIAIKNRLGSSKTIRYAVNYSA